MVWDGYKKAVKADPAGVATVLSIPLEKYATPERLSMQPSLKDELAWVIEVESTWDPAIQNPYSNATGLIQFIPSTAAKLGTTTQALKGMNRAEQARYVQAYLDLVMPKPRLRRPGDLYLSVFYPNAIGNADSSVIAPVDSKIWTQNPGLREGSNGPITAGSVRRRGTAGTTPIVPTGADIATGGSVIALIILGIYLWRMNKFRS